MTGSSPAFLLYIVWIVALAVAAEGAEETLNYKWWDIGQSDRKNLTASLARVLRGDQRRLATKDGSFRRHVLKASKRALEECVNSMQAYKWDCSRAPNPYLPETLNGKRIPKPYFGNFLSRSTRESAYVHALTAAAMLHQLINNAYWPVNNWKTLLRERRDKKTREGKRRKNAKAKSTLDQPSSKKTNGGGARGKQAYPCSPEDYRTCAEMAEFFTDFSDRQTLLSAKGHTWNESTRNAAINRHNSRAGRSILLKHGFLRKERCHGVSSTCAIRTSYRVLMPFAKFVSRRLQKAFHKADQVHIVSAEVEKWPVFQVKTDHGRTRLLKSMHLAYLRPSPNFCKHNEQLGIQGTVGRRCRENPNSGVGSCVRLCCKRGKEKVTRVITRRCNCQFVYCCRMECDKCTHVVEEYHCV